MSPFSPPCRRARAIACAKFDRPVTCSLLAMAHGIQHQPSAGNSSLNDKVRQLRGAHPSTGCSSVPDVFRVKLAVPSLLQRRGLNFADLLQVDVVAAQVCPQFTDCLKL